MAASQQSASPEILNNSVGMATELKLNLDRQQNTHITGLLRMAIENA